MKRPNSSHDPAVMLKKAARLLEDCSTSPELDRQSTEAILVVANTLRQMVQSMNAR